MAHHFIAFDLGAESGRALIGTLDGDRLTLEEKHRFSNPNGRMNGLLQWNLLQQWEELKTGLKKAVMTHPKIDGLGVDTWGVDFGLLTHAGEILGNPACYRDSRTDGILERTFRRIPKAEVFEATGIQFMQFNTLFQLIAMRDAGSALLDRAETMLFMPDLFHFLFTGERKSEISIASTSQMINPRTRQWATTLVERAGIPTRILPLLVPSGSIIGTLQQSVRDECGAGEIPVIAPGSHDTASAVAAVPSESADGCYISSGTWSLMGVELDQPVINAQSLAHNYTNEIGVENKIRFLKNIMGLWLVQECRRHWQREGKDYNYTELTQFAADATPFVASIDPDHSPFLSPGEMPLKIARYCGETKQAVPSSPGEMVRTCLESLALTYRKTIEGLQLILGREIKTINIVGGGTQNELLSQMTADACSRPVVAGPIEATAIGNILTQAMAVGAVRNLAHARQIVRASFPVKRYEPQNPGLWDRAYERYQQLAGR